MATRKVNYTQQNEEIFLAKLNAYEQALKTGTKMEIIATSLAIHAAKGLVHPSMRKMVNQVFKNTTRETPLV